MRIVGGKYRGKKLISPQNPNVRPTSDRAREAVFNIFRARLGADFSALRLVDVFCGSGAVALEAISQGFAEVAAVDVDVGAVRKNAAMFPAEKNKLKIVAADARQWRSSQKYDVMFMDAPYQQGLSEPALVAAVPMLADGAWCLIELRKDEDCALPENFELLEERRYGLAKILIARFRSEKS